jgi:hypothetical protein
MRGRGSSIPIWARRTCSQRTANVRRVERYVKARLETIFAKGFEPLALPIDQRLSGAAVATDLFIDIADQADLKLLGQEL